jgi:hypothetical protein
VVDHVEVRLDPKQDDPPRSGHRARTRRRAVVFASGAVLALVVVGVWLATRSSPGRRASVAASEGARSTLGPNDPVPVTGPTSTLSDADERERIQPILDALGVDAHHRGPEDDDPGQPPTAAIRVDGPFHAGEEVGFSGGSSDDPDGIISHYLWDFDSDGHVDHRSDGSPATSHTFPHAGTWKTTLVVVDDEGLHATATKTVQIVAASEGPPERPVDVVVERVHDGYQVHWKPGDGPPAEGFILIFGPGSGDAVGAEAGDTRLPLPLPARYEGRRVRLLAFNDRGQSGAATVTLR